MKTLVKFIAEKLNLGQAKSLLKLSDIDVNNSKQCTVYILYSPMKSHSAPKWYKGTYNQQGPNEFSVAGPYIKNPNVCLTADFKKGINYDNNSIVACTKLSHGYMFVTRDKDYLEKLNKTEILRLKLMFGAPKYMYMNKSKEEVDIELKKYIEDNLI